MLLAMGRYAGSWVGALSSHPLQQPAEVAEAAAAGKPTVSDVIVYLGEHYRLTYFLPLKDDPDFEREAAAEMEQMPCTSGSAGPPCSQDSRSLTGKFAAQFPHPMRVALNRVYDWPTRAHPISRWYGPWALSPPAASPRLWTLTAATCA